MAEYEPAIVPGANSLPPFVPRAVVAVHEEARSLIESDEIFNLDWELLKAQFRFGSIVVAHNRSVVQSVIWENALLGFEYDRAAGECSDEEALRLQFNWRTWLYQGRDFGNENCINFLANVRYEPTDEEEVDLYMRRGMKSAAGKHR